MELLKQEKEQLFRTEENLTKDQQVQFLQQTMQGMQQVPAPTLVSLFSRERDVCMQWRLFAGKGGGEKRTAESG